MSDATTSPADYTVDAVDTAMELLSIIALAPGLGVSELGRRCGQTKARTFRLLWTLEQRGLVTRSPEDATYHLGHTVLIWGAAAVAQNDLVRLAQPVLKQLGEETHETTKLRVRDGMDCLTLAKWEPDRELRCHSLVGRRHPLRAEPGELLLAFATPDVQREAMAGMLPLAARKLLARLARIRDEGFKVTRREIDGGRESVSIALPVFDQSGSVTACLALAAPASRMDKTKVEALTVQVRAAARQLSSALGHRHRP